MFQSHSCAAVAAPRPLLIRFGRLGDTLLLQPLLRQLHHRYGQPCDLLAVGAWPAALYRGQPDVGQIYTLQSCHQPLLLSPQRWRLLLALRGMRGWPIYVAEPQPRALAKIRRLLRLAGIAPEHICWLTDLPAPPPHEADKLLALAACTPPAWAGRIAPACPLPAVPQIEVAAAERAAAQAWLQSRGLSAPQLVLLQPANKRTMRWNGVRAAADDEKAWPVERWAALARGIRAAQPQLGVLICGAAEEACYVQAIVQAAADPLVQSGAGELPLPRLLAIQAQAHSMISVDTGPAHLAAAVDCPLVVLFGSLSPAQWCPRSAKAMVTAIGGAGVVQRIAELPLAQVLAAWQALSPRHPAATASPPDRPVCV